MGYLPARIIPAAVSIAMIVAFTHMMSTEAFGHFTVGFSMMMLIQGTVFFAVDLAILRLYPAAEHDGTLASFVATTGVVFAALALLASVVSIGILLVVPAGAELGPVLWLAVPALVLRAAVSAMVTLARSGDRMLPFNILECGHSVLGFGAGLLFVWLDPSGAAPMRGLVVAGVVSAALGAIVILRPLLPTGKLDLGIARMLGRFAFPLTGAYFVSSLLLYGDRLVIQSLAGASALGIYAVAVSFVERPISLLSTMASTVTFPLTVRVLETQGRSAARKQTGRNATVLLTLILPACVGIALLSDYIAPALVGPAFVNGMAALLPVLALAAATRAICAHYLDHAAHLARRPEMLIAIYGPVAALNLGLDLLLVPSFGAAGAAWASAFALLVAMAAGIVVARRIFPLALQWGEVARIAGATAVMAVALAVVHRPLDVMGLVTMIVIGMVTFAAAAIALDVSGARKMLRDAIAPIRAVGRGTT
jgi:O-antigen/teichoic acid export membrane protein